MSRSRLRTIAVAAAALVAAAMLVVYALADPSTNGWFPRCTFRVLTGWKCPGCGSQRALHALLHGDLGAAWDFNPYLMVAAPLAVALFVIEMGRERYPRLYLAVYRPAMFYFVLIATIGWWIMRNIFDL